MSLLRSEATLPGAQVWSGLTTDATSRLDVAAAAARSAKAVPVVGLLLGRQITVVSGSSQLTVAVPDILDHAALDAFKRLQQRCRLTGADFWQLLWCGSAAHWEECITNSFATGASMKLQESTITQQLVQEFKVALCIGRKLVFGAGSADVQVSMKRTIQCREASGVLFDLEVDLLFPGEARSVVRLVQAWWDAKGGKPSTKEAKVAHAAAKPSNRAMPTRFSTNLLMLCYWQESLLNALVEIEQQMLANKAAGISNWNHPGSLCSGGRYANCSAAMRAVQAARGTVACAWHIATGGRQAEAFRWRGTDSSVAGVSPDGRPPVWCLGLAGADVLAVFQEAEGTGWAMINWHAKGIYDYGSPDYMPFWPPGMSGICLGAIINFGFHVLTFLQPTSPAKPILQHNLQKANYQPSSTAAARKTLNNPRGYMFPYGELKHLPALEDPVAPPVSASAMAGIVNNAISSAAFLGNCWTGVQAAGTSAPPDAAAAVKYNAPSMYSMRYTHAGEVTGMQRQLGIGILPADFWAWYLQRAGRSELSNSYATYAKGYEVAYEARLPYIHESTSSWSVVVFRRSMLSWSPRKPNEDVSSRLTEAQQASLQRAVELAQQYAANPSTEAIWLHLIGLVEQEGSFAGMLRRVCGPLVHQSYELLAFSPGADLAWLCMTPAQAQAHMARLLASINAANVALFGPLPDPPTKRVLLQNTVDLLCCDVDSIKLALASPQARAGASISAAAAAVQSALQSAAAVAALTARGDDAAAARQSAAAVRAAQAAVGHASQLQLDVGDMMTGHQPSSSAASPYLADLPDLVEPATAAAIALPGPTGMPVGSAVATDAASPVSPPPALQMAVATAQLADLPDLVEPATAAVIALPGPTGMPVGSAVATDAASPVSPPPALQMAEATAQLAAQLVQGPQPVLLPRGSALLLLFGSDWDGKATLLQAGKALVAGQAFSHFSVVQLMSVEGLLLRDGFTQSSVPVRVAAEFLAQQQQQLTGHWSKSVYKVNVTPGRNLLLHSRATHTWGKKFTTKCSAAAGYQALFNPDLSQANVAAALGALEYEPHRPVRSCVQRVTAAASNSQPLLVPPPPDAAAAAAGDSQQLLRKARRAVSELAMSLDGAEADACFAAARKAVMPLLRHADTSCASSAKALLLGVYDAVYAGDQPPAGAVEQLLSLLSEVTVGVAGSGLNSSCTLFGTAATAAAAAEVSASPALHGSSKRPAAASSGSRDSKVPKLQPAHERLPPAGADGRPGFWLPGNFYVQSGDTLFVELVPEPRTISDPCTFTVRSSSCSSGSGSNSSSGGEEALVWMLRLESFTDTHVFGRFYLNKQRCIRAPLRFQGKAQRLERAGLQGVFHTLLPGAVLQQLGAELAAEVEAALFEAEDA